MMFNDEIEVEKESDKGVLKGQWGKDCQKFGLCRATKRALGKGATAEEIRQWYAESKKTIN